jgi:hypothetical protein
MFLRVPSEPTIEICGGILICEIIGFYAIFGALLYRAYKIGLMAELQQGKKERVTPEDCNKHDTRAKVVFGVVGIIFAVLGAVGLAIIEEPALHSLVVDEGVRNFEHFSCTRTIAGTIFIALEGISYSIEF